MKEAGGFSRDEVTLKAEPCLGLENKQQQFNAAMELYTTRSGYRIFGKTVSFACVSLQLYLLYLLAPLSIGLAWQAAAFVAAFVLADFVNGVIHMIMDHNDSYDSVAGPLVAAFHLHHKTPMYKVNPLHVVYFNETGAKVWLVPYLLAALFIVSRSPHPALSHLLVYFGILSSVAEVSHYLCHTSTSRWTLFLGEIGVLLPKRHHARHHGADNNNYAFLNGCTDPLINLIARAFFPGYKRHTDLHFARYTGEGTANR